MSNVPKLKKRAVDLEQKKQFDKALLVYEQIFSELDDVQVGEGDVALYNRAGDLTLRQGNVGQAVAYYEKAVDLYTDGGFFNNAIALCNKILRNAPGRSTVYYKLGKISARKGFVNDAKQNFLEYADRMQKEGQLEEAFRALKEFADLCPDQDDIRLMLADQLVQKDRRGEAVEQLTKLYEKLSNEGRTTEARATAERIRAIDPAIPLPEAGPAVAPERKRSDLVFLDVGYDEPSGRGRPLERPGPRAERQPRPEKKPKPTEPVFILPPEDLLPEAELPQAAESAESTEEIEEAGALPIEGMTHGANVEPELDVDSELEADSELEVEPGLEVETGLDIEPGPDIEPGLEIEPEPEADVQTGAGSAAEEEPEKIAMEAMAELDMVEVDEEKDVTSELTFIEPFPADDLSEAATNGVAGDRDIEKPMDLLPPDEGEMQRASLGLADVEDPDVVWLTDDVAEPPEPDAAPPGRMVLESTDFSILQAQGDLLESPRDQAGPDAAAGGALDALEPMGFEADPFVEHQGAPDFGDLADTEPVRESAAAERPALGTGFEDEAAELLDSMFSGSDDLAEPSPGAAQPDDPDARWRKGELLCEKGDRDAGVREMEAAMMGFERRGDFQHARSVVDAILHVDPNSVHHHQKRVEYAVRAGDTPSLVDAYMDLADCFFRAGDMDKSRAIVARVLDLAPDDPRAIAAMDTMPEVEGEPAAAEPDAEPAFEAPEPVFEVPAPGPPQPRRPTPRDSGFVNLADWLRDEDEEPRNTRMTADVTEPHDSKQVEFDEMLTMFKAGVAANLDEGDTQSHYDLGVAYKEMGLLDEAIAEFQKALRGTEQRVRTYESLGQCFVEKRQYQIAMTILGRALNDKSYTDDVLVGVLYLLGYASEMLQNWDDALGFYQRVVSVDMLFRDVRERLVEMERKAG